MKMKLLLSLCFCAIAAYLGYNYVYQEHRNIQKENAVYELSSTTLFKEFSENEESSNAKYINRIITISGEVNSVTENQIVLIPGIVCQLDSLSNSRNILNGDFVKLKGRCIGFDDLFMEVKMDNSILY